MRFRSLSLCIALAVAMIAHPAFAQSGKYAWKPSQWRQIQSSRSSNHSHNHGGHHHGRGYGGYYRGHGFGGGVYYNYGFNNNFGFGNPWCFGPSYYGGYYSSTNFYGPYGSTLSYGTLYPNVVYPTYVTPNPSPLHVPNIDVSKIPQDVDNNDDLKLWLQAAGEGNQIEAVPRAVQRSTATDKLRSQQDQIKGDTAFKQADYLTALRHYKSASNNAEDLSSPLFRLAATYAAMGRFEMSATYIKKMLQVDPNWPHRGETLLDLFGEDNLVAMNSLLVRLSNWAEADIRDPDRLLVVGTFLFGEEPEKAVVFLKSSAQFSKSNRYLYPFIKPVPTSIKRKLQKKNEPVEEDAAGVPPLPEDNMPPDPPQPEPERKNEPSADSDRYQPKDLGFIAPRHGGEFKLVPETSEPPALEGPVLPPVAN